MPERRFIIVPVPLTVTEYTKLQSRAKRLDVSVVSGAIRDHLCLPPEPSGFRQSGARHLFEAEYRRSKERNHG